MSDTLKLRHVSLFTNPRDHGLTPYHVFFIQEESGYIRSLLDDGIKYRHPEHQDDR